VFSGKVRHSFVGKSEWRKIMTARASALCALRLVKMTSGENAGL